ncbi:peptidoglycan synthetase [Mucilaginibacter robiniae]|uniref:Peptidoglycan synthetase n=1 Tax=Mucilaginibacter robiniae TaxID=2728022 RepID=A0A7L5EBZ5_9SPHI|nr:Mur ligase family protein [Mucilaginibacter robiniae]QJD97936.1 peptidoglycan synthetase [Mucilaginibacter robiniae]
MRVHFIAIGGSAMHNLAMALYNKGFQVTGSDDVLFEPSISRLSRYGLLPEKTGWYPEKITNDLDAVILGMHARADNPELLKAQELGIKIYSYPEYIYEQSKNKLRVVVGGSHGKTTITSMILHALQQAGQDFDYLVGAQLAGFDTMVKLSDAPVIVIEGDEYLSSAIDRRPKFHLYQGHIGVISGIAWDHINVFPTFESYTAQFELFIQTIQPDGIVFYAQNDVVLQQLIARNETPIRKEPYKLPEYEINNGITSIISDNKQYPLQVFGEHNLLNIEAAHAVCSQLNISTHDFYNSMSSFKGAARRLELLGKSSVTNIYKDFAHSPSKLKATIEAVKSQFPERKLIACIELHTFSSLDKKFLNEYAGSMDEASKAVVFIDAKTFEQKQLTPYSEDDVKQAFARADLIFLNNSLALTSLLEQESVDNANVLLMSSGNFGGIDLNNLTQKILNKTGF